MIDKQAQGVESSRRGDSLCCISVNKIFDSARDKDCLEDLKVYLPDCAQDVIDKATAIRSKNITVAGTNISVEAVPFNRGYYQVCIRYYFCITFEACVCGGRAQEIKGLCVCDKKIILFGSEKNVSIFKSDPDNNNFCTDISEIRCDEQSTLPTVVVEVAGPICLDVKIVERCKGFGKCCMGLGAIPESVRNTFDGVFTDGGINELFVSIGVFSIIRMERSVQIMLPATNFCLPDKDSTPASSSSNPCNVFGKMNFPMQEFYPYAADGSSCGTQNTGGGCCGNR